ncbi:ABC transporter permease [Solidesulfovibrio carbinoliphilus]|uniref:ABC transporter permease n=1 Tax=Solidesulfovibrio carbinoliphilus TaxID=345370 RepID=UPI000680C0C5|nr:ABC transporter permease [Solidesulfovibrio carbinoliphilus]
MSSLSYPTWASRAKRTAHLFFELVLRDFKAGFLGSYLSVVWAFLQPGITVLLLWFVFEVGFRAGPQGDRPFILWLLAGLIPWFFFSEAWAAATQSILGYRYLVKNIVFPLGILPLVKIGSSLIVHMFFLVVVVGILVAYRQHPGWALLQIPYYLAGSLVLLVGLSWLTSSLIVFIPDVGYMVATCIQFGFWFTPIMWNIGMVPARYVPWIALNPAYYLIDGYRRAFLYGGWFWERPMLTGYFWLVTLAIFFTGRIVFQKLRPHFADVI